MKTARFLKNITDQGRNWKLYEVCPPQEVYNYNAALLTRTDHVIVSASMVPGSGPETYIFAADETGHITCWTEMDGSEKGHLDHEQALRDGGYRIVSGTKQTGLFS